MQYNVPGRTAFHRGRPETAANWFLALLRHSPVEGPLLPAALKISARPSQTYSIGRLAGSWRMPDDARISNC